MIPSDLVDLSRLQFALTAMYHFIFVPLTLGLSFMLVVMELAYVISGKQMYKDMTRFWGKLFGINFAIGVATGLTMEFQFGTNWAYYSHYVGDIFGAPLAIEGLMAFFLESTFIGLFFFGWDRLSRGKHLLVTFLMALGSNLSALWILVANGWMMNPIGAEFNFETMRMEMTNFWAVFTSEWAQAKFVHTIGGGYMTGSFFVMAISAYYMLKRQDVKFAASSFRLAAAFGLVAAALTLHMGDESGYLVTRDQPTKIAAMEAIWDTHEAPAPLSLFAIPDQEAQKNHMEVSVPWLFGLMGTRSLSTEIPGIKQLTADAETRIVNGQKAVSTLEALRKDPKMKLFRRSSKPSKRSWFRPSAEALYRGCHEGYPRNDQAGRCRHHSASRPHVLELPRHDRLRFSSSVALYRWALLLREEDARHKDALSARHAARIAAALDRL